MGKRTAWKYDLTGQKFELLLVKHRDKSGLWFCECDCGNTKLAGTTALMLGAIKSCGCWGKTHRGHVVAEDLTGQPFGWLKVIKRDGEDKVGFLWLCECKCGKFTHARSTMLKAGRIKSCGCWRRESRMLGDGESMKNNHLLQYKKGAETRKLEWNLADDQFFALTQQNCHYCGAAPRPKIGRNSNGAFVCNGIDRIDNKKGYTTENIVPCCTPCNLAKRNRSYQEFIEWLKRAGNYQLLNSSSVNPAGRSGMGTF